MAASNVTTTIESGRGRALPNTGNLATQTGAAVS